MRDIADLTAARAARPDQVDELRRRAAHLARPLRLERGAAEASILFELSGETFAIAARVVRQIIVLHALTPLPGAPLPLFGVTQWRGDVLTVLDVREALGVPRGGLTDLGRVIVVDGRNTPFGILADAVRDVRDIRVADVRPLPADDDTGRGTMLRGITADDVLVIDDDVLRDLG